MSRSQLAVSVGKASTAASSAGVVFLTSAILPRTARGAFATAVAGVTLAATVASLSLWFGFSIVLAKRPEASRQAVAIALLWPAIPFTVAAAFVPLVGISALGGWGAAVTLLLVSWVLTAYSILQGIPIALGRMETYGLAEIVRGITGLLAVSILLLRTRSPALLLAGWGIGCVLATALLLWRVTPAGGSSKIRMRELARGVIRPSLALHPTSIIGLAVLRLDIVVLAAIAGRVQVAYYTLAVAGSEAASLLPSALGLTNFSNVARTSVFDAFQRTTRLARRAFPIAVVAGIAVAAFMTAVIHVALSRGYMHALPALYIALVGTTVYSVSWVLMPYIAVVTNRVVSGCVAAATLVTNMALLFPLGSHYGATGAAVASSIAYVVGTVLNAVVFRWKGPNGQTAPSDKDLSPIRTQAAG